MEAVPMLTEAEATRIALKVIQDVYPGQNLRLTCQDCSDNDTCEYAFDPYNTHGDCLAIK